jgi:transposase
LSEDIKVKTMPLGHVAALMRANEELNFVDIVDKHTTKKDTNGLSVGEYLLLQLMGRAEGALSRKAIAKWYPGSVAKLLMSTPHKMNAKNLLKQLDYPTPEAIRAIEDDLAARLLKLGLVPSMLLWDTTNFYTQIEDGGDIPKKGHSKDKRNDRNLIGVGMAVSGENVPFFHEVFEANKHDSKVFSDVLDVIVERLAKLKVEMDQIVMVLDKGNNSDENIAEAIKRTHIIGTLRYDQAKEYIRTPLDKYRPVEGNKDGLRAHRTRGVHYGESFTIVVTHNPSTEKKQRKRYEETKVKVLEELASIKKKVENRKRRGRKWTQTRAVRAIVDAIPLYMRSVFDYDVRGKVGRGGGLIVEYRINRKKEKLKYLSFGKIVHFTDLHDWSDEQISTSYNAKYQIEDDFKWLKDKLLVPIKPVHVRTDQHIRGHVFVCVMGLLFYRFVQWILRREGLLISTRGLAEVLDGIRLAILMNGKRKKKGTVVVEHMDKEEATVFSLLRMGEFIKA